MLLVHVLLSQNATAQQPGKNQSPRTFRESGSFYFKNYSTKVYTAAAQNWDVIQDKHGNMAFANGDGVLLYDGKRWSLIETPAKSVIRSMKMRRDGRIFIGALDDLGYLDVNDRGQAVFVSLLDKLSPDLRTMGNIWTMHTLNDAVYFESEIGVFVWNDERFEFYPWPDKSSFHKSFLWRGQLYASEPRSGLLVLDKGRFKTAPGGEVFRGIRIYAAMPLNDVLVFGSKYDGLFKYDGRQVTTFQTEADNYLKQHEVYTGIGLPDGFIGVGTKFGGVVVVDETGTVKSMIRTEDGILTNGIRAMYLDQKKNLWLALEVGISQVEIANPLSIYDERAGLTSAVNDICRFQGKLYVANIEGVFVLEPALFPDRRANFSRIALPHGAACWALLPMKDRLLIGSTLGVLQYKDGIVSAVTHHPATAIHRFIADPNRIVISGDQRLYSMQLREGRWMEARGVDSLALDNMKFNETIPGKLWINTYSQGATLVSYVDRSGRVNYDVPIVKQFGVGEGLPEGFNKINSVGGYESFRVGVQSQLLRFDDKAQRFVPDSTFSSNFGFDSLAVFPVTNENENGAFLMKTKRLKTGTRKLFVVEPSGGNYVHREFDMSRIFDQVGVITFWDEAENAAWHVGVELIVRQQLRDATDSVDFSAYINKVIVGGDSILFDGSVVATTASTFPYALNSFRFEYTSNNFVAEETNLFQHKLEGFDEKWSEWSTENIKEYSSLWEGQYRFLVRSKNYTGRISRAQSFDVVILPPWYRSIPAYFVYVLALALAIWSLVKWRSAQLEKDKVLLQAEILRQTTEIREQNLQLEKQSDVLAANARQLQELDTLKSNFFVNISHEFRTPLSLIVGPLEKFMADSDSIRLSELQRMHRSAKRLQQLINQLLDLAKLESGTLKVVEQRADLLYFLRVLSASFESLADTKAIRYEVHIPTGGYEALFDKDKVETILYNLLSNAFKFTPEKGRIDLDVALPAADKTEMLISIKDTGPGIPAQAIDHIFDRFYQVDGSSSREFEGSGIGLSLVREIVSLLKGSVTVQSEPGVGTAFTVRLPMPGTFLADSDHIVSPSERDGFVVTRNDDTADLELVASGNSLSSAPLILLVEDNKDLREYLQENLEVDYRVESAENGALGLDKAVELVPDLILSDMMMPLMDGFTLCTRIRADERISHIPFILLTARATIESKLQGLELGADDYMIKPFNLKEIQVRIKNLLEQRTALRRSYSRALRIEPRDISVTSVDEKFLQRALEITEANLADQQFSVERFADLMGMSRKNLLRKIKAMTDQSVNEFIRNFRLKRAHQLIQGRSGTVSEVAYSVGFNNLSYFSKCFKELYDVAPGELLAKSGVSSS